MSGIESSIVSTAAAPLTIALRRRERYSASWARSRASCSAMASALESGSDAS